MELACPICNKEGKLFIADGKDFFISDGNSKLFDVYYCDTCQVGYSMPYMEDSKLSDYYPDDFESYTPKKSFMAYIQSLKYKSDLKLIEKRLKYFGASIFEIGAGRGEFLAKAKKRGFLVDGVEPGAPGRKYSKEKFDITLSGELAETVVFKEKYDIIAMRHVLEHINSPVPILERIFDKGLKSGGFLFLKLPRLDSWEVKLFGKYWHGLDLPRHRMHYTKDGIINILHTIGFTNIRVIQEVVPSDIMRSIQYYSNHDSAKTAKLVSSILRFFPPILQLVVFQFFSIIMMPFKAGRLIVLAKR